MRGSALFLALAALAASVASGCVPGTPAQRAAAEAGPGQAAAVLVLPLPRQGPPVVDVTLPGYGKARFLVDTGGQFTWIDSDYVRRTSLPTEVVDVRLTDANGNVSRVRAAAVIDTLGLGGSEFSGLRPLVVDSIHRGVDGALGQDVLRSFLVVFDGPGLRLVLIPGQAVLEEQAGAFEHLGRTHRHTVDWSSGIPRVEAHLPALGASLPFVIDTGSEHNTLPAEAIRALDLRRVGSFASMGLSGRGPTVGLYEVDGLQIEDLLVFGLLTETPNAALGWDTLRSTVLVFENATDSLYLLPGAVLHPDWPAER